MTPQTKLAQSDRGFTPTVYRLVDSLSLAVVECFLALVGPGNASWCAGAVTSLLRTLYPY